MDGKTNIGLLQKGIPPSVARGLLYRRCLLMRMVWYEVVPGILVHDLSLVGVGM